jgi:hypothetical protein
MEILKKRRGRKKFILIDFNVKERLSKRDMKYLEKVKNISMFRRGMVNEATLSESRSMT